MTHNMTDNMTADDVTDNMTDNTTADNTTACMTGNMTACIAGWPPRREDSAG